MPPEIEKVVQSFSLCDYTNNSWGQGGSDQFKSLFRTAYQKEGRIEGLRVGKKEEGRRESKGLFSHALPLNLNHLYQKN